MSASEGPGPLKWRRIRAESSVVRIVTDTFKPGRAKTLLRVLTVLGLVAVVLPATTPASYTLTVPGTLHAVIRVGGQSGPRAASVPGPGGQPAAALGTLPFAATHLGFEWHGPEDAPEIRTSADGRQWSAWARLTVLEDLSDPEAGDWFSDLVGGRGARYVEVRDPHGREVSVSDINVEDGPPRTVAVPRGA